ncbi:MAG: alcohol dehydrogenase catalytic domain-containing protein [Leucobacter sp.]
MRTVTYVRNKTVEIVDKPIPDIGADEVLVKITGAGLCHSDLHLIEMGDDNPLIGSTLGHEGAGIVERVGEDVTRWKVGDAVLVALVLSCGECRECLAGRDSQCLVASPRGALAPAAPGIGTPGCMAEYLAVKSHHLDSLEGLDPATAAPLADAALTPMHSVVTVRPWLTGDATVVVLGLGGLGHVALQILAATCGSKIIALDTDPEKLKYAESLGALAIPSNGEAADRILAETGGRGADVVLDYVGVQPTVDLSLKVIAQGGAIRFVGLGGGNFPYAAGIDPSIPWGVNVERPYGGNRSDLNEALALARNGKIHVEVTHYALDDAVQAFHDLEGGKIQGRIVLVP